MNTSRLTADQYLLNLSGLIAVGLSAWISIPYAPLACTVLFGLFTIAFLAQSFTEPLMVPPRAARVCVLLMLALSFALLVVVGDTIVLVLAVVIMASAPHHFSVRSSWILMAVASLIYALILDHVAPPLTQHLYGFLTLLALQAFALTSSIAKVREIDAQQALLRSNSELRAARAVMATQSKAEERLRIAGDLHDSIGHRLTALQLQLEVLNHEIPENNRPQLLSCKALAKDLLEEVRTIVRSMSRTRGNDLCEAITELDDLTPGVALQMNGDLPDFGPALSQQLVFCIQEAVNNAIRHGGAQRIDVSWDAPCLLISDNGRGLGKRSAESGFGLMNINKRLAPFGGHASLSGEHSTGCTLRLELPGAVNA